MADIFAISRRISFFAILSVLVILQPALLAQEKKAEEKKEKPKESSRAALLVYAEAAGYQNNKQFDLAAAEWAKFLDKHEDDPRAIEALYNLGICQIQQRGFSEAIENLERVVGRADDKFERIQDAYLNLGWSQYSLALENQPERFPDAAQTFSQLLTKFPETKFADQALFFGGESLYLQGKFEEAVKSYSELIEKHDDSDLHADAMYALGVTMEQELHRFKDAGEIFEAFMKLYPTHDLATEVKMRKAETILQSGDFDAAEKLFAEVAAVPDYRSVDHAKYRHAFCIAAKADVLAKTRKENPNWQKDQAAGYLRAATIFTDIADNMKDSPYASDATMAAGRSFYRAKDYANASQWFKRIIESDSPDAPEAAHWQARMLLNEEKTDEARDVIASVMKVAKESKSSFLLNLYLDDADALYKSEISRKDSVAAYLKIADDYPDHRLAPKALYNAAYGAMEVKDYEDGLAYAERFNKNFSDHSLASEVQKVVAECKLQLGDLEEAAKNYEELASSGDKEASKFELRRGLSLYLKKNYEDAITTLTKVYAASDVKNEKAEAAYWLGRSYADSKNHEDAITAFANSQSANAEWQQADEVLLNHARSLRKLNRLDEAKAMVGKIMSDFPDSKVLDQANYRLGEFCYTTADYGTAIKCYTKVLESWPKSKLVPYSLYGRGWSQLRAGVKGSGLQDFAALTGSFASHPLAAQGIYGRGMAEHQNGDHKAGLASVDQYLKTNPTGASKSDAMYLRGICLIGLKQLPDAVATLSELLKSDPGYAGKDKVLYELAWAYKNGKDDAKALSTFSQLVSAAPKSSLSAEAHYHIGEDLYTNKKYSDAITKYTAANSLAKTNDLKEKSSYKLGWSHYQAGQYERAIAAFDTQLKINDKSNLAADAEFMRAESYFKSDLFKEAYDAYGRAKQKPSKNQTMQTLMLLHGGQAAGQLKEWKTSYEWLAELRQKFPKSPYVAQATYEQGWALQNLGKLDEALQAFSQVSGSSRNELGARSRFMVGEVLFKQKAYAKAILEFRRVMFGYGADSAPAEVKQWQAKSGFEAGRCAAVLASQTQNGQQRQQLIEGAKSFFAYVVDKHPSAAEAKPAKEELTKLGPAGNQARR